MYVAVHQSTAQQQKAAGQAGREGPARTPAHLEMHWFVISGHAGFLNGLGESLRKERSNMSSNAHKCEQIDCSSYRVRVASAGNVLRTGTVLHSNNSFSDQLPSVGPHDVNSQDSVGLLVSDHLDNPTQTLGVVVAASATVGHEGAISGG